MPVEVEGEQRRYLNVVVLLFFSAAAAFVLGRMLWPFITAIMIAVVLAVLSFPAHARLRTWVTNERLAAFLGTIVLFFLVFLPILALSYALFNSLQEHADTAAREVSGFLSSEGPARQALDRAQQWLGLEEIALTQGLESQFRELGSFLAGSTVGLLSGLGGWMVQAGVALFTLFFLLRDGELLTTALRRVIPLDDELTQALLDRSGEIIYATMFGNVVVGIAQGILGGLAFWALDIPGALLWGTVMGVLGLIPVLGPPIVWVPTAIVLFVQGEILRALLLTVAGFVIVGTVDNVLRAVVVGDRARLHPLVVFFSALGGILVFGPAGIFFGPVLFVLSISILNVTRAALDPDGDHATP